MQSLQCCTVIDHQSRVLVGSSMPSPQGAHHGHRALPAPLLSPARCHCTARTLIVIRCSFDMTHPVLFCQSRGSSCIYSRHGPHSAWCLHHERSHHQVLHRLTEHKERGLAEQLARLVGPVTMHVRPLTSPGTSPRAGSRRSAFFCAGGVLLHYVRIICEFHPVEAL